MASSKDEVMRKETIVIALCAAFLFQSNLVNACTIFKVSSGKTTLVGNNEDDNNPDTKVWFLAAENGKHGRVFFGYNDGIPQGGMNDQGLFFDWVADNPSPDWKRDPKKLNYPGSVSEKILEDASTVEEALRFYETYNETAFLKSRTMLVDKTGASAIVSWKNGQIHVQRAQAKYQAMGFCGDTADKRLAKLTRVSVANVSALIKDCLQSGEYPTQYSNLYDLQRGEVYVYRFHQNKPAVRFNLATELRKGHHFYNLPLLSEQLKAPLQTDSKTQPIVKIDPAAYATCAGKYLIPPDYVMKVKSENGRMYIEAPDVSRAEIYPASPTKFFIRSLDSYLLFKPGPDGRAEGFMLYVHGREAQGKRIE